MVYARTRNALGTTLTFWVLRRVKILSKWAISSVRDVEKIATLSKCAKRNRHFIADRMTSNIRWNLKKVLCCPKSIQSKHYSSLRRESHLFTKVVVFFNLTVANICVIYWEWCRSSYGSFSFVNPWSGIKFSFGEHIEFGILAEKSRAAYFLGASTIGTTYRFWDGLMLFRVKILSFSDFWAPSTFLVCAIRC